MSDGSKAADLHSAYLIACATFGIRVDATPWAALPDKGARWYALANLARGLEAVPMPAPLTMDLGAPIKPLRIEGTGEQVIEDLPTAWSLRPILAGDLEAMRGEGDFAANTAVLAKISGIDRGIIEGRMHAEDVFAGIYALSRLSPKPVADILEDAYIEAGGKDLDHDKGPDVWEAVAYQAMATDEDDVTVLRTRTSGAAEIRISLSVRAVMAYEDGRGSEWRKRLDALALATSTDRKTLAGLYQEDATRAWLVFEGLKKKSQMGALARVSARLSPPSSGGPPTSSTPSPSDAS